MRVSFLQFFKKIEMQTLSINKKDIYNANFLVLELTLALAKARKILNG